MRRCGYARCRSGWPAGGSGKSVATDCGRRIRTPAVACCRDDGGRLYTAVSLVKVFYTAGGSGGGGSSTTGSDSPSPVARLAIRRIATAAGAGRRISSQRGSGSTAARRLATATRPALEPPECPQRVCMCVFVCDVRMRVKSRRTQVASACNEDLIHAANTHAHSSVCQVCGNRSPL